MPRQGLCCQLCPQGTVVPPDHGGGVREGGRLPLPPKLPWHTSVEGGSDLGRGQTAPALASCPVRGAPTDLPRTFSPLPFQSTGVGAGWMAGKRVFEESGPLCISTPNVLPQTPPGPSPAPARPDARVRTCPTRGPLCLSSWAVDRLQSGQGCRTPPSRAWQEG